MIRRNVLTVLSLVLFPGMERVFLSMVMGCGTGCGTGVGFEKVGANAGIGNCGMKPAGGGGS